MATELIPFNMTEIQDKVKEIFLAKGLTDILYPGSNLSQISDAMSYLIHVLNTNTAINLQEVILPLANKRMNVLFGARQLGYEARQKTSYRYSFNVSFKNKAVQEGEVLIPRYTIFESNGNKYYYVGEEEIHITGITDLNKTDKEFKIEVKEGDLVKFTDNELLSFRSFEEVVDGVTRVKQNYLLPFTDVEDDGIEIWLSYTDDNGQNIVREKWKRYEQFLIDSSYEVSRKKFVRLQNIFLQNPTIFFEIGGLGNPIRLNTLIEINLLETSGSKGKAGSTFSIKDQSLSDLISIDEGTLVHTGTDAETSESIKENAPIFHNSANRAVTALDYVAMTQRHEAVKYADVWGGEEEYYEAGQEAILAQVFFSFFPERTVREFLSTPYDSTSNKDEVETLNRQFDLQNMPRRPLGQDINDMEKNWYLDDVTEIKIQPGTPIGQTDGTVFSELEPFKIMTMKHKHRQPCYMNFDYTINIIKYSLSEATSETNKKVFDVINEYFMNYAERLDFEYFASNLQTIIDQKVGNQTGIDISLSNDISLYKGMYDESDKIKIRLAFPFQDIYDESDNFIGHSSIPNIDTNTFTYNKPTYVMNLPKFNLLLSESTTINCSLGDILRVETNNGFKNYEPLIDDIQGVNGSLLDWDNLTVDFLDATKWKEVSSPLESINLLLNDTIEVSSYDGTNTIKLTLTTIGTGTQFNLIQAFVTSSIVTNTGTLIIPTAPATAEQTWTATDLSKALYVAKDNNGKYSYTPNIEASFNFSDDFVIFPIYLGSEIDNGSTDPKVGEYIIRNSRSQLIEVHLDFTILNETEIFTDSGFGYLNVVYPGNLNSTTDNIPFTDYTMPRLRQVKFQ